MGNNRGSAPATDGTTSIGRSELIEQLASPIKYSRAGKHIARIAEIRPFDIGELERIIEIGEQTERWEPARIAFYQDERASAVARSAHSLSKRIGKLLRRARADLVSRLWKSSNYPTARMYMDALRAFQDFAPAELDRLVAVLVENERVAGMRLELRQFLFYRDLVARHGTRMDPGRVVQLVGVLRTAVESDPSLVGSVDPPAATHALPDDAK
jgi:hypothetical protein